MISMLGLHGSSGHPEFIDDFLEKLAPDVARECPRGTIADGDGFTFFKRRTDRSIPPAELIALARESLATGGCVSSGALSDRLIAGYSSGAIFGTALLAVAPALFVGAVLLRPQPIAEDFVFPDLSGKPVLVISGMHDDRREPHHAFRLAEQLSAADANVTHHDLDAGHGWGADDLVLARAWMAELFPSHGTGQGVLIRTACVRDLPALVELYQHLAEDDEKPGLDLAQDIFERLHAYAGSAIIVGESDGVLAASCTLIVIPNLTRGGKPYGLIENVVTHRDFRKRGFGKRILQFASEAAWKADCYKVMLMTGSKKPETLDFYRGAGFEQSKTGFQMRRIAARAET